MGGQRVSTDVSIEACLVYGAGAIGQQQQMHQPPYTYPAVSEAGLGGVVWRQG